MTGREGEGRMWGRKERWGERKDGRGKCSKHSARGSWHSTQRGTVMGGGGWWAGACKTGTRWSKGEGTPTQGGSVGTEPGRLKPARPRNVVHKNHVPGKINRAASRPHAVSVADKRRLRFVLYQQMNSVGSSTCAPGTEPNAEENLCGAGFCSWALTSPCPDENWAGSSTDQHSLHFSLPIIIVSQWTMGSSLSGDVFLLGILRQKMSCGKTMSEATHADDVPEAQQRGLRSPWKTWRLVFPSLTMTSANKAVGICFPPFHRARCTRRAPQPQSKSVSWAGVT